MEVYTFVKDILTVFANDCPGSVTGFEKTSSKPRSCKKKQTAKEGNSCIIQQYACEFWFM